MNVLEGIAGATLGAARGAVRGAQIQSVKEGLAEEQQRKEDLVLANAELKKQYDLELQDRKNADAIAKQERGNEIKLEQMGIKHGYDKELAKIKEKSDGTGPSSASVYTPKQAQDRIDKASRNLDSLRKEKLAEIGDDESFDMDSYLKRVAPTDYKIVNGNSGGGSGGDSLLKQTLINIKPGANAGTTDNDAEPTISTLTPKPGNDTELNAANTVSTLPVKTESGADDPTTQKVEVPGEEFRDKAVAKLAADFDMPDDAPIYKFIEKFEGNWKDALKSLREILEKNSKSTGGGW